jgi:uncharacterized protein YdhG (YjbR/CyaY superfamily)
MGRNAGVMSVDEYIAACPPERRARLTELRSLIVAAAPGVTERISYGMPTFDLRGKVLMYFAAWKSHVGLYPVAGELAAEFAQELTFYTRSKAAVQLPYAAPLPTALLRQMLAFRVRQLGDRAT